MEIKKAFNKNNETKISFEQLMELVGTTCNYKFCIVDENIDDDLMKIAAEHGVDLTGFKHVIETSGIQHAEKRHGKSSKDRTPLTLEDYLLVPYIIKTRDKVRIVIAEGASYRPPLYVLIIISFFIPFPRPTDCKDTTNFIHRNIIVDFFI
jgi:hypothetical protein